MNAETEARLNEIRSGKGPPLLLLYGDDFQVRAAAHAVIDLLVPAEHRAFNLEQFDGRATSWERIEEALMTPPFFPGRKAVLVENVPYFLSSERRGEIGAKLLDLWGEGKKEEAVRLFIDLLVLQGWNQERWEESQGKLSRSQLLELLDTADERAATEANQILEFALSRGLDLGRRRGSEGHRLTEVIEQALPPWAFLLLTASHLDRRSSLFRKFMARGATLDLNLERDRSGRVSRETVAAFVSQRLKEENKKIEPAAKEMILIRAGDQFWSLHRELEKLLLYVGAEPSILARDVREVFADQAEAWVFDLTRALGNRDTLDALRHLARLFAQGEHPLRLLATIASEVRRLLLARQLIDGEMHERWKKDMTFSQFQASVLQKGAPLITRNPYADYMCFQRADNFTGRELARYLHSIYQADIRLKSTATPAPLVIQRLILEMCLRSDKEREHNHDQERDL